MYTKHVKTESCLKWNIYLSWQKNTVLYIFHLQNNFPFILVGNLNSSGIFTNRTDEFRNPYIKRA